MSELEIRDIVFETPNIETELRVIILPVRNTLLSLGEKKKLNFISNPTLSEDDAIPIASIHYKLEREKVRLSKYRKMTEHALRDLDIEQLVNSILELQEEYDDTIKLFLTGKTIPLTANVRRCVFRTLDHDVIATNFLSFFQLYNKWTVRSAEYLIVCARRDHDMEKFRKLIHDADQDDRNLLEDAQQNVAKEYEQNLLKRKRLLSAYVQDLHTTITKLDKQYPTYKLLENVIGQAYKTES